MCLRVEKITIAKTGSYHLTIRSYLFADAGDVDIDGAVEHDGVAGPYRLEDILATEHMTRVAQQQGKELKLQFGERYLPAIDAAGLATKVETDALVGHLLNGERLGWRGSRGLLSAA